MLTVNADEATLALVSFCVGAGGLTTAAAACTVDPVDFCGDCDLPVEGAADDTDCFTGNTELLSTAEAEPTAAATDATAGAAFCAAFD